jgi:general secretion pathway protein F
MPVFAYRGLSAAGRAVGGVIDADSARSARGKLREQGIFPTDLNQSAAAPATRVASVRRFLRRRVPAAELALVTRQLATLLGAGLPLVDALGTLADQIHRPMLRAIFSQVRERVREGAALADALAMHGHVFSSLYVNMVRAGETAGALEVVLGRLADYSESQAEFVNKVRGALTYPIIMLIVAAGIVTFLMAYVVPQITGVFAQTAQALPASTQALLWISNTMSEYWLLLVAAAVGLPVAFAAALRTATGREIYDRWLLRAPYIGPMVIKVVSARMARTLATLLSSGVQLLTALDAVKLLVANRTLAREIENTRDGIREGHGMANTLGRSGLFPPLLIEMIRVGERSGELEPMLERAADAYEREVASSLAQMTTFLEPMMTVLMAGIIVFMILAVLTPIFQLNQLAQ